MTVKVTSVEKKLREEPSGSSSVTVLRDRGPYSARNSSKGALIFEAGKVVEGLGFGLTRSELRVKALNGSVFTQRARTTRRRIWEALHHRYLVAQPEWVLSNLQAAYSKGSQSREFVSLLYVHYVLRDRLTYDFVTEFLWERWVGRGRTVSREDVLFFLDRSSEAEPRILRWSEETRVKLAQTTLAALRDFGLLVGVQKKRLVQPMLPLETAEHLLRLLTEEGVRGVGVLHDSLWRLFLCHEEDVADLLSRLAQTRQIQFERAGNTVVLHTPDEWGLLR